METIQQFNGKYRFLSNFWPCSFWWNSFLWPSSEHAYQAAKSTEYEDWVRICQATVTPGQAKRMGKSFTLQPDWEQVKYSIMLSIVKEKFYQDQDLMDKLNATESLQLEEGNTWGDKIWGISPPGSGIGQNLLGKILMQVRGT